MTKTDEKIVALAEKQQADAQAIREFAADHLIVAKMNDYTDDTFSVHTDNFWRLAKDLAGTNANGTIVNIEGLSRTVKNAFYTALTDNYGMSPAAAYQEIELRTQGVPSLLFRKNMDYGNGFEKTYLNKGEVALHIRIMDKIGRIENLLPAEGKQAKVSDESIIDTFQDLMGYLILSAYVIHKHGLRTPSGIETRESVQKQQKELTEKPGLLMFSAIREELISQSAEEALSGSVAKTSIVPTDSPEFSIEGTVTRLAELQSQHESDLLSATGLKKNIYLFGGWFDTAQRRELINTMDELLTNRHAGHIYVPLLNQYQEAEVGSPSWAEAVFKADVTAMKSSDMGVGVVLATSPDSGSAAEVAWLNSHGKAVVLNVGADLSQAPNLMLTGFADFTMTGSEYLGDVDLFNLPIRPYDGPLV